MSDLNLPPPAAPEIPKWLQFPRDMNVSGDMTPAQWHVSHTPGMLWLWIRQPLNVYVQNFDIDSGKAIIERMIQEVSAAEAEQNAMKPLLVAQKKPLLGPNGQGLR